MDLTVIWAVIIAFAVAMYVVMDGFDLGIGILFPAFPVGGGRNRAMNSIAPVWDGNETWLVLGGGGLMAAFPLAYAIVLPALYTPLIAMLLGLVFRGRRTRLQAPDKLHAPPVHGIAPELVDEVADLARGVEFGAVRMGQQRIRQGRLDRRLMLRAIEVRAHLSQAHTRMSLRKLDQGA